MKTTAVSKKQTAFRLDVQLLDMLRKQAQMERRSLNNYVEGLLYDAVYREPNDETIAAIDDARNNRNLVELDLETFTDFVASL